MNITLIGYRGSGKTTVGRLLAQRLGRTFVDTDVLITQRAGKTIQAIFETAGETAFRDLESAVVADVAQRDNQIIATGGGVVLRPQNVAALKSAGKIVWLRASPEELLARIHADPATTASRPPLTQGGVAGGTIEEIQKLLATREPFYRAAADAIIDAGNSEGTEEVVRTLLQQLQLSAIAL